MEFAESGKQRGMFDDGVERGVDAGRFGVEVAMAQEEGEKREIRGQAEPSMRTGADLLA
jgi:hypothetical protein